MFTVFPYNGTNNDMYLNGTNDIMIPIQVQPTTYKAYQAPDIVLLQNDDPTRPKLHKD